jgi:ferredoxin
VRYDERDMVFARAALGEGTPEYEEYYGRHPQMREADDRLRALRGLAAPGTRMYRPDQAAVVESVFAASDVMAEAVERSSASSEFSSESLGPSHNEAGGPRHAFDTSDRRALTRLVKQAALFLGADDVGIAPLEPGFVYSHRGRTHFGDKVDLGHSHAVVLVFEMRPAFYGSSPELSATCETGRVYQALAAASFSLADALRRMGLSARAHVDANYLVLCAPLAELAGLGEVGRNGVLVHHTYGPGVRLGVVTVDADLEADERGCWGIADFCRVCGKCAENCPSGSILKGEPVEVRGALKWPIDPERCYKYWRTLGTDCGLCLRTCPFAKPDTWLHRFVRWLIRDSTSLHRLMLRADDLFYGRNPDPRPPPLLASSAVDD